MPITQSDVETGWLYKTPNTQERVVLGCSADCKVIYASRGGNAQNASDHREMSSLERFTKACSQKVRRLSAAELQNVIELCHAQGAVVLGEVCCFSKN